MDSGGIQGAKILGGKLSLYSDTFNVYSHPQRRCNNLFNCRLFCCTKRGASCLEKIPKIPTDLVGSTKVFTIQMKKLNKMLDGLFSALSSFNHHIKWIIKGYPFCS